MIGFFRLCISMYQPSVFCRFFARAIIICAGFVSLLYMNRHYQKVMNSFALFKIIHVLPIEEEFTPPSLSSKELEDIRLILSQPFSSYSHGSQSFVFLSKDGKYILKFNKFYSAFDSGWLQSLPLFNFVSKGYKDRLEYETESLKTIFKSYLVAYEYFRQETGLIYHHLKKSDNLHQKILLIDKKGYQTTLQADEYAFVVQKKGVSTYQMLSLLMQNGEQEKASCYLDKLLQFVVKRGQKGIHDWDFKIKHNLGFIDGVPAQIDLGSLILSEEQCCPEKYQEEIKQAAEEFRGWLINRYPSLVKEWDVSLEKALKIEDTKM